jgi:RNA polymerase sigma factor for flagellar operon FliA
MISMEGVPSVLIAKNQSWVRKQAQALVRHLPANVERADLIQVGLIAVAQAAVSFEWAGERDTDAAQEAFVRYARMRVKGAMLDELRQMDFLTRGERRKIKVIQIARERFRGSHGKEPSLGQLAGVTGLAANEISSLMQADSLGRNQANIDDQDDEPSHRFHPATAQEEVEARVDTGIVLRRLEKFFAELPERERMVIEAYLGVGLTPIEVAKSLKVSPSRVSQIYHSVVRRVAIHMGHDNHQRATDRQAELRQAELAELVRQREAELQASRAGDWGQLMEDVLVRPVAPRLGPALAAAPARRPAARTRAGRDTARDTAEIAETQAADSTSD